ncbi:TetR/AcrR family transcriptional regulator [Streptomyces sp. NPDC059875]|uniref:TetR/AcrR family transcriptional regulator n=1 Tax=unclassified Streptomyces TaxID=2593676 RepID=UPI0036478C78
MVSRRTPEETRELRASLIEHAQRLVEREGPQALTMRALATEAGCAVGLPYKIFANREELIAELVYLELGRLRAAFDAWAADAGSRTVGENLTRYARILLETHAPSLTVTQAIDDAALKAAVAAKAHQSGLLRSFESTVTDYLLAEQRLGRIAADVDAPAYGFLITGAVHNLLAAGESYPRPDPAELDRILSAIGHHLAPAGAPRS